MYDLNIIKNSLKTNIIGNTIIQYDALSSVYEKTKSIFGTCPDGTVVLCGGMSCNNSIDGVKCIETDKNINLCIILKSLNNNYLLPLLNVAGCSSVQKSISELYEIDLKIKWPDSLLSGNNKIAGISSDIAGKGAGIILSLNINLNLEEKNENTQREELVADILNNIEFQYDSLIKFGKADSSVENYNENLLFSNKEIRIMKKGRKTIRRVIAKNIDNEGWLIVINESGNEEMLNPGDTIILYEET